MPTTGLYFLPTLSADSSPLPGFLNRLTNLYNPSSLPRWTLDHRLFRETTRATAPAHLYSTADEQPNKAAGPRYMQVLTLSHHLGRSYVTITSTLPPSQTRAGTPASSTVSGESTGEPATVISIPSGAQSEEFIQLMVSKFGPLWTPRQITSVRNGQAFRIGDYNVRVGEIMQGNSAAAMVGRGVIVEIEWAGANGEDDAGDDDVLVQAFWQTLDVKGARECLHVAGVEEEFGSVRQWCEVLRIRN